MDGVKHRIVSIERGCIKLEIALDCGGRIAQLIYRGKNMLMGDAKTWRINPPMPTPQTTDFIQYYGAETWIGPQKDWWLNQNLNIEQRESPIKWPPDPFVSYGRYSILSKTKESITITSEPSPLTGIRMAKVYEIDEDMHVKMTTNVINTFSVPRRLDIWHIARVPISTNLFFPTKKDEFKVEGPTHDYERNVLYRLDKSPISNGDVFDFQFDLEAMKEDAQKRLNDTTTSVYTAKAFCWHSYAESYNVLTLRNDVAMTFSIDSYPADKLEEGASPIEVYCYFDALKDKGFYEIEFHSPSYDLQPGEIEHFTTKITLFQKGK